MSLLSDYEERTSWKYKPIAGCFHTHEQLANKVNQDGSYVPFFGSTVVFITDEQCIQPLQNVQTVLHILVGDMLAEPLPPSTLHMTLHDLICPELCASDPSDEESYSREVADSFYRAESIVNEIKREYAGKKIVMEADRIVNMVSKSLVLMLRPHSESDYELLLEMFRRFDCIVRLDDMKFTPHITLAYFRLGMLDGARLGSAVESVQIQKNNTQLFEFSTEALTAQTFRDMKTYF